MILRLMNNSVVGIWEGVKEWGMEELASEEKVRRERELLLKPSYVMRSKGFICKSFKLGGKR
jgi:hypothetical protein